MLAKRNSRLRLMTRSLPLAAAKQAHLRSVLDLHRRRGADLTMLLKEERLEADKKGKMGRPKRDDEDVHYTGLTNDNR